MLNNELEKGLRDRLYDLEEAVNTDATWLAVEAGLRPKKKKRRGIIWWWLSGGFMLLALGGWLLWPTGDANHPGLLAEEVLETTADVAPDPGEEIADGTKATGSEQPITEPNKGSEPSPLPEVRKASVVPTDQDLVDETTNGATARPAPVLASTASLDKPRSAPALRRPKEDVVPQTPTVQQPSTKLANIDAREKETTPISTEVAERLTAAVSVATLPIALLPGLPADDFFPELPTITGYITIRPVKPVWTLEAGGGVAQPYRTIVAVGDQGFGQRDRNLATERPLEAVTADLLAGYRSRSNWTLRGGLSYQRVNSVVEARIDNTVDVRQAGITEIILNPGGDTTFITGLVNASVRTTAYNRYYNQLTTIDVPLLLGKTFNKGKWRFGIEAGPVINLITSGNARYQLAEDSYSTRAENAELFRKRLGGVSWRANLSAGLLLMPGLEANIGLSALRQGRGGFEVEGSATQTTYDLVGIRIGIRRSF